MIGGEEFKRGGRGRATPPVQSSVLGVQKRVLPSSGEIGVAFLERRSTLNKYFRKIEQVKDPKAC